MKGKKILKSILWLFIILMALGIILPRTNHKQTKQTSPEVPQKESPRESSEKESQFKNLITQSQISELCALIKNGSDLIEEKIRLFGDKSNTFGCRWHKNLELDKIHVATTTAEFYSEPEESQANVIINCFLERKITQYCLDFNKGSDYYGNFIVHAAFAAFTKNTETSELEPQAKSIINEIVKCGSTECKSKHLHYKDWDIYVSSVGSPIDWVKITFK